MVNQDTINALKDLIDKPGGLGIILYDWDPNLKKIKSNESKSRRLFYILNLLIFILNGFNLINCIILDKRKRNVLKTVIDFLYFVLYTGFIFSYLFFYNHSAEVEKLFTKFLSMQSKFNDIYKNPREQECITIVRFLTIVAKWAPMAYTFCYFSYFKDCRYIPNRIMTEDSYQNFLIRCIWSLVETYLMYTGFLNGILFIALILVLTYEMGFWTSSILDYLNKQPFDVNGHFGLARSIHLYRTLYMTVVNHLNVIYGEYCLAAFSLSAFILIAYSYALLVPELFRNLPTFFYFVALLSFITYAATTYRIFSLLGKIHDDTSQIKIVFEKFSDVKKEYKLKIRSLKVFGSQAGIFFIIKKSTVVSFFQIVFDQTMTLILSSRAFRTPNNSIPIKAHKL